MSLQRGLSALLMAAALALASIPAVSAGEPETETVPSFNESPGCDALDGLRGPLASTSGILSMDEPIYGPWGDFYGRTIRDVWEQLVPVQLPGQSKTLYVHQRVLPAFEMVLDNLAAEAAKGRHYKITSNTWSWSRYTIPPTRKLSFHTVGAAIDVNSTTNPYRADNVLITDMPQWFVDAWVEAGWCWGGSWQTIKDPMHFSWKGPLHTFGYEMPPPQAPLVGSSPFRVEVPLEVGLAPLVSADHRHVVADTDRDGAVDIARIEPYTADGKVGIRSAVARHDHDTCAVTGITASPPLDSTAPVFLVDLSHDARPDLTYVLEGGSTIQLEVFVDRQWGEWRSTLIETAVPSVPGSTYLFDDADNDGHPDLFVIAPGERARLTIWAGPGFSGVITESELGVPSGQRFALGDRDVDGLPDLLAVDDAGTMTVHPASAGYTASARFATEATDPDESVWASDLDGDGRSDLVLVSPDGSARLLRGGKSTHDPGLWYRVYEDRWTDRQGCLDPAVDPMLMPLVPTGASAGRTIVAVPEYPGRTRLLVIAGEETVRVKAREGIPIAVTVAQYDGKQFGVVLLDNGSTRRAAPFAIASGPRPGGFRFGEKAVMDLGPWRGHGIAALIDLSPLTRARVALRGFDGERGRVVFGGLAPVEMAMGRDRVALLGTNRAGNARIDVKTLDGVLLARRKFDAGMVPASLDAVPGGYLVTLAAGSTIRIELLDRNLATVESIEIDATGEAAVGPASDGFLIARRRGDGLVVAEARDFDGSLAWSQVLPAAFDPATVTESSLVAVTAQRAADGAALLILIDPSTGTAARSEIIP